MYLCSVTVKLCWTKYCTQTQTVRKPNKIYATNFSIVTDRKVQIYSPKFRSLKIKTMRCLETSVTDYPFTRHLISEIRNRAVNLWNIQRRARHFVVFVYVNLCWNVNYMTNSASLRTKIKLSKGKGKASVLRKYQRQVNNNKHFIT